MYTKRILSKNENQDNKKKYNVELNPVKFTTVILGGYKSNGKGKKEIGILVCDFFLTIQLHVSEQDFFGSFQTKHIFILFTWHLLAP